MLTLDQVNILTGGRIGTFDVACLSCGPQCRTPANQRRNVLRIWRLSTAFATYRCARCELHGYARDGNAPKPDAAALAKARHDAQRFAAAADEERRRKARLLWNKHQPSAGSPVERYLRKARGYQGPIPRTIGFLPGGPKFAPAMITAFAFPSRDDQDAILHLETTGTFHQAANLPLEIHAVHLTRLAPDGSGKAGTDRDKIMIGTPRGVPIVLAPVNDGLGLSITEGIESGLSIHEATGLGVWAAGSAPFLPALADAIPRYVETVSVIAEPDEAGRRFARDLAILLYRREIDHRVLVWHGRQTVTAA